MYHGAGGGLLLNVSDHAAFDRMAERWG
jgi:hypothetical protein